MTWYTLIYCRPPAEGTFGRIRNLIIIIIISVTVKIILSISVIVFICCGHPDNNLSAMTMMMQLWSEE